MSIDTLTDIGLLAIAIVGLLGAIACCIAPLFADDDDADDAGYRGGQGRD